MKQPYFTSDLSGKKYHQSEKVSGKLIRRCIATEIQKEHPNFSDDTVLSLSELSHYRSLYMKNAFTTELGELGNVEQQVLDHLNNNQLISDHLINDNDQPLSYGQKLADKVAAFGGSWKFIILFSIFIVIWMGINVLFLSNKGFDPYPFILLNLILSCIAALQAPVIMMSQNRQEEKDRQRAQNDYMVNLKSEMEIRMLHEKIDHLIIVQQEKLMEMQQVQVDILNDILQKMQKA